MNKISLFALDEADEIFNSDYINDIILLFKQIKNKVQILLISATISKNLISIVNNYLNNPIKILLKKENIILDLIDQYYLDIEVEENKFDTILDLYNLFYSQVIIFL